MTETAPTMICTPNLMRSSQTLPTSKSSLERSNSELLGALRHALAHPGEKMEPLLDERSEYHITTKVFFLPTGSSSQTPHARASYLGSAIAQVLASLSIRSVELLILSFPDIILDADDTGVFTDSQLRDLLTVYRAAADLVAKGSVKSLGVAEFSASKLRQLCETLTEQEQGEGDHHDGGGGRHGILPSVNQINLKDCCVTPRDLIVYAKQTGVTLFTHGDEADILPTETLRQVMHQHHRHQDVDGGAANHVHVESGRGLDGHDAGQVPLWVCKYTAVASTRGVVENKGYIVALDEDL